jgi:uncharacterized cupredoxin-like copper-binding protein
MHLTGAGRYIMHHRVACGNVASQAPGSLDFVRHVMFRSPRLLIALVAAAWLLAACADSSVSSGGKTSAEQPEPLQVEVALSELKFTPPTFSFEAGRPVVMTVRNTGTSEHDFVITGMPARDKQNAVPDHGHRGKDEIVGHVKPGDAVTIRFTPTQRGQYGFFCSLPGHKEGGMIGVLTVT